MKGFSVTKFRSIFWGLSKLKEDFDLEYKAANFFVGGIMKNLRIVDAERYDIQNILVICYSDFEKLWVKSKMFPSV